MPTEVVLKAYKFALAPTKAQEELLRRYAGAARWAYNHAIAEKIRAHQEYRAQVDALVASGIPEDEARKQVKVPLPTKPSIQKEWVRTRGDSRKGIDGICPWWWEVNNYCFQSAFTDADAAWKNWLDSLHGKRAGRRMGYPRFKKKGRCRDSFRIHHNAKAPSIRLTTYRRLNIPKFGEIRIHGSGKRLAKMVAAGKAVIQSVTVSRSGHRWFASVLCKITVNLPDRPSRRQRTNGTIGVDIGVIHAMAFSKPVDLKDGKGPRDVVDNPRHLSAAMRRLKRAQRALSRTQPGSRRRERAQRRVARLHALVAQRRATWLHHISKRLTTSFATIVIEDLDVVNMTRSARGTRENPGRNVRAKAGLNRSILDVAPGEFARQLDYKASWYGSKVHRVDRWFPSSKTCSVCGWQNPSLTLAERLFKCDHCGTVIDRDINAARNIAAQDSVAPDGGETLNARGVLVRPAGSGQWARDGEAGRLLRESPQRSDPLAFPALQEFGGRGP